MRIFVAGATGAIGRPLIAQLLDQGHDVFGLTRSPEKARTLAEQGVEPAIADVFDADAVHNAISNGYVAPGLCAMAQCSTASPCVG